jgi:hypothetical protein
MTTIGLNATISEKLTGDVCCSPRANENCVATSPKNPPIAMIVKSFPFTFSLLVKRLSSQNIADASNIRDRVNPSGVIHSESNALAMGIFNPNIVLAQIAAR